MWRVARNKLSKKDDTRIERLHRKRHEGLSEAEQQELTDLMKKFSRFFVLRNEAADLLLQRGHDVSSLFPPK